MDSTIPMSSGRRLSLGSYATLAGVAATPGNPTAQQIIASIDAALEFNGKELWTLRVLGYRQGRWQWLWLSLNTIVGDDRLYVVEVGVAPDHDVTLAWWVVILQYLFAPQ